jgi:hypothetical protein
LFDLETYICIGDYLFERSTQTSLLGYRFVFFFYDAQTIRFHVKIGRRDLKQITAKDILMDNDVDALPSWGNIHTLIITNSLYTYAWNTRTNNTVWS